MKAITFWQPWASLIMVGAKPFEFRSKSYLHYLNAPRIGERIVIHAGARPVKPAEVDDLLARLMLCPRSTALVPDVASQVLEKCRAAAKYQALPLACGLGTATLGTPRNAGALLQGVADSDRQAANEEDYNWAWPLGDIVRFDAPVPMRGAQGFWQWPERAAA